jgi:hypothetical protein
MLKNFARTAKRAGITAAIGLTLAVTTAGPALAAGTWHKIRTYPTAAACSADGHLAVRDGSADAYQCRNGGKELWLLY